MNATKPALSRRALLRGAGGIAITLPFLEFFAPRSSRAGNPTPPKRFFVFYTPNGFVTEAPYDSWTPSGTETSFTLNTSLQPLAPYQQKLIVLRGLSLDMPDPASPDVGHVPGMTMQLTGMPTTSSSVASGVSLDEFIAQKLAAPTKLRAVRGCVQESSFGMFYSGPSLPIAVEEDPAGLFDTMFSDFTKPPDELAKLRAQRKSVLDAVLGDLSTLRGKVGTDDRARLDAHASAIRDLEQQIAGGALSGASCSVPTAPTPAADWSVLQQDSNVQTYTKQMLDLMAMGIACDLSRVFAFQSEPMGSDRVYSWLGVSTGHHTLSHAQATDQTSQKQLTSIKTWYAQQFAYLLGKLAAIQEVDGTTALDNTVVFWTSDMRWGGHDRDDMRHVLAGSCGGYFKTGRYVQVPSGHYVNDLHVSLANAMDIPITTFGNASWCKGALPNLT